MKDAASVRAIILAAEDRAAVPIEVPEWGVTVYLRPLSVADRMGLADAWEKAGSVGRVAKLVTLSVHSEDGSKLFGEGDEAIIAEKSATAVERIAKEVRKMNKLNLEDREASDEKKDS